MKECATFIVLLVSVLSYGQTRMIMNDSIYLKMANGVYVTLDNSASSAVSLIGTQKGRIISEDEDNAIVWNIGTTTGTYSIPYADGSAVHNYIPFECEITTAGVGPGRIRFSTYRTPTAGSYPFPSMVSNLDFMDMFGAPWGLPDSLFAVDRYWLVETQYYTTKPAVTLEFSYVTNEAAAPNTITEANLQAYRFNYSIGEWEGATKQFGSQVAGSPVAKVTNVVVLPVDLYAAWTLADKSIELPIELQNFQVFCKNGNREIRWQTVSESDNDYFEIQKSTDGVNFEVLTTINGAGNSSQLLSYSFVDQYARQNHYYRLKQVDFNGEFIYSDMVFSPVCTESDLALRVFPNPSSGLFTLLFDEVKKSVEYTVSDISGKQVIMNSISNTQEIQLDIDNYDAGVYFLSIKADGEHDLRRVVKK